MIALSIALIVSTAVLGALVMRRDRQLERLLAEFRDERAELLNRVQHPTVFQPTPRQLDEEPERLVPDDEFSMAGRIYAGEPDDFDP